MALSYKFLKMYFQNLKYNVKRTCIFYLILFDTLFNIHLNQYTWYCPLRTGEVGGWEGVCLTGKIRKAWRKLFVDSPLFPDVHITVEYRVSFTWFKTALLTYSTDLFFNIYNLNGVIWPGWFHTELSHPNNYKLKSIFFNIASLILPSQAHNTWFDISSMSIVMLNVTKILFYKIRWKFATISPLEVPMPYFCF